MEGAGQNSWRRRRAASVKGLGLKTLITRVALPCQRARPKQGALYNASIQRLRVAGALEQKYIKLPGG